MKPAIDYFEEAEKGALHKMKKFPKNFDWNMVDAQGDTLLHNAVLHDQPEEVRFLLRKCDINARNSLDETAIANAAQYGLVGVMNVIIRECELDSCDWNKAYRTSLQRGHIPFCRLIIENAPNLIAPYTWAIDYLHGEVFPDLRKKGYPFSDFRGFSLAEYAISSGNLNALLFLLDWTEPDWKKLRKRAVDWNRPVMVYAIDRHREETSK